MLAEVPEVVAALRCPVCVGRLAVADSSRLACRQGHSFDLARQGYATLVRRAVARSGDSARMVAARSRVLGGDHFALLTRILAARAAATIAGITRPLVADLGAGTGHYLAAVLDAIPAARGLAVDSSPYALRRAAGAHPRLGAIGADISAGLPIASSSVDLALDVFAPRNGPETARILTPRGVLLVVTPAPGHLAELRRALRLLGIDADKRERMDRALGPQLQRAGHESIDFTMTLSHEEVVAVVGMGPSARHLDADDLRVAVASLPGPMRVSGSVELTTYRATVRSRPAILAV